MVVGEPTLMGGEFGDEDERLITRLENTQYDGANSLDHDGHGFHGGPGGPGGPGPGGGPTGNGGPGGESPMQGGNSWPPPGGPDRGGPGGPPPPNANSAAQDSDKKSPAVTQ
nr:unnamed protein product [Callosobruchus chinensis]